MRKGNSKRGATESANATAQSGCTDPEMDDLGEDYLAAAVVRLVQTDVRVQSAILDMICARLKAGRR